MVIRVVGVLAASVGTAITLLFVNGVYLYNKFRSYLPDLNTGSFWGTVKGIYNVVPGKQKISLLVQLGILLLTTIGVLIYTLKQKAKPILSKVSFIKSTNKTNSSTDLDTLYKMLLSKKEISVGDIETAFKISHEVAMDWCKILENADLALIDYPTFKKPILRVPEEKKKEEDIEEAVKKAKETMNKKGEKKSRHLKVVKSSISRMEEHRGKNKEDIEEKKVEISKPKIKAKIVPERKSNLKIDKERGKLKAEKKKVKTKSIPKKKKEKPKLKKKEIKKKTKKESPIKKSSKKKKEV